MSERIPKFNESHTISRGSRGKALSALAAAIFLVALLPADTDPAHAGSVNNLGRDNSKPAQAQAVLPEPPIQVDSRIIFRTK